MFTSECATCLNLQPRKQNSICRNVSSVNGEDLQHMIELSWILHVKHFTLGVAMIHSCLCLQLRLFGIGLDLFARFGDFTWKVWFIQQESQHRQHSLTHTCTFVNKYGGLQHRLPDGKPSKVCSLVCCSTEYTLPDCGSFDLQSGQTFGLWSTASEKYFLLSLFPLTDKIPSQGLVMPSGRFSGDPMETNYSFN